MSAFLVSGRRDRFRHANATSPASFHTSIIQIHRGTRSVKTLRVEAELSHGDSPSKHTTIGHHWAPVVLSSWMRVYVSATAQRGGPPRSGSIKAYITQGVLASLTLILSVNLRRFDVRRYLYP